DGHDDRQQVLDRRQQGGTGAGLVLQRVKQLELGPSVVMGCHEPSSCAQPMIGPSAFRIRGLRRSPREIAVPPDRSGPPARGKAKSIWQGAQGRRGRGAQGGAKTARRGESQPLRRRVAAARSSRATPPVAGRRGCYAGADPRKGGTMTRFKAAVFDWAGTMIDFGSFAPMGAFVEVFRRFGITASMADARGPMGLPRPEHIRAMLAAPHLAAQWQEAHGSPPDEAAIDAVYAAFVPLNEAI